MDPLFSVVMPIHNQAPRIHQILNSVVDMTLGTYELLLIVDGCTDDTLARVQEWIAGLDRPSRLRRIELLVNPPPGKFETSCDNQGFRMATGTYLVELQADMKVLTLGYNILLASPLAQYPDLIAVSGRCCHRVNHCPGFNRGKLGGATERPHEVLQSFDGFDTVFLSHSVNRGPLVLRASMVRELGYLDEDHYVLGDDEHDLFARAWVFKQWRCGFVPVEVYSPLEWGSTRTPRSPEAQAYLDARAPRALDGFWTKHYASIAYPNSETRPFRVARGLV